MCIRDRIIRAEKKRLREYVLNLYDEQSKNNIKTIVRLKYKYKRILVKLEGINRTRGQQAYYLACSAHSEQLQQIKELIEQTNLDQARLKERRPFFSESQNTTQTPPFLSPGLHSPSSSGYCSSPSSPLVSPPPPLTPDIPVSYTHLTLPTILRV